MKEAIERVFNNELLEGREADWETVVRNIERLSPPLAAEVRAELRRTDEDGGGDQDALLRLIALWISKASWSHSTSTGAGGIVNVVENARLRAAVTQFVRKHILKSGGVPVGAQHLVEELSAERAGIVSSDGIQRAVYRPGVVEIDVAFPACAKVKLIDLSEWPLEWVGASNDVQGLAWTALDRDPDAADDDVYVVGSQSTVFLVRVNGEVVTSAVAVPSRPAKDRSLYLNTYEGEGMKARWSWNDLDTDEVSQEFKSKRAAIKAMRDDELNWSRFEDIG